MKQLIIGLFLAVAVPLPHRALAANPGPVELGSADHFTILAGRAITSTGGGTNYGDVGLSPASGVSIGLLAARVNGTLYAVDANGPAGSVVAPGLLSAARVDFAAACADALGRSEGRILLTAAENLGGQFLAPGLYYSPSSLQISDRRPPRPP